MKNKNIIHLTAGLVAIGMLAGFGLYRLGLSQGMTATATPPTNTAMAAAPAKDKKVLYWHDPMVPTQKFDQPGKSPFMDMQLVPVYADGDSNGGNDGNGDNENSVSISPRVQQNLGIRTTQVLKGNLSLAVAAVGSVAYNERELTLVQARNNGFIEKLYVRAALDMVKKGQALAELYVPDWVAAQEEFLTVKRMQTSGIEGLLEAAKQRMRLVGMSDEQIHLVETSSKVHPRITITAPVGGVITELSAREGMTVMTGAPMFRINGLATIWVNADVPENSLTQIRPGNTVEASTPSLPGTTFNGKISAILPQVDMTTRTLKARIELNNPSGQLVPGMFATIKFNSDAHNNILLVPTEAIIQTGTRSVVMIAQDNGKFMPVDVETGMEANGQIEIRKGLEVGQKLVVSGQFLVDSEASLKATTTRMSDGSANDAMTRTMATPALPSGAKK